MDCHTAHSLLLDEVYEDLELHDSAELATHVAGCAACSEELLALKAFRSDCTVPAIEVPAGLTARIMAAVDEAAANAQAPVALPRAAAAKPASRPPWARVVSHAGAWAMRVD